jgi:transcriptional regulator with XRE-family HTH domain
MEQLKRLREARGLSQTKLAARADVNPATVNQIEGGKRTASPATLHKLAAALDVTLYELLEGEPHPKAGRSSLEPSLLNGLEDERRRSRFAEVVALAAERWGEAVASTDMDDRKRFGIIDAALDLSNLISESVRGEEDWEALAYQEQLEIVTTMEKLTEVAEQGISHLRESGEAKEKEEQASQRRAQIKEMTRLISA